MNQLKLCYVEQAREFMSYTFQSLTVFINYKWITFARNNNFWNKKSLLQVSAEAHSVSWYMMFSKMKPRVKEEAKEATVAFPSQCRGTPYWQALRAVLQSWSIEGITWPTACCDAGS